MPAMKNLELLAQFWTRMCDLLTINDSLYEYFVIILFFALFRVA